MAAKVRIIFNFSLLIFHFSLLFRTFALAFPLKGLYLIEIGLVAQLVRATDS